MPIRRAFISATRAFPTIALIAMLLPVLAPEQSLVAQERAHSVEASVRAESADSVPFYVVKKSVNGEPEFLFAIAQRFLGNGDRYIEIFELNEGRPQDDGGALTDPSILEPGWVLQLPADASGEDLQFGPSAEAAQPQPQQSSAPPNEPSSAESGLPMLVVLAIGLGIAVLIATAGWILWRRIRRPSAAEPSLPAGDRSASWTIDSALKIVTFACTAEQITFPGLYLVTVDGALIHLHLTTPSSRAPSGWTPSPDGRIWKASLADLQLQVVPNTGTERFSGVATLGATDSGRLLLDFNQAHGPVSVEGPATAVADVVEGWLAELTSNPWSGSPQIVRLAARGTAQQETLGEFLAGVDSAQYGIAVVEDTPSKTQGEALRALYARADFRWIFIIKGPLSGASWKFTVQDRVLSSDFLPDIHFSAPPAARLAAPA